MQSEADADKLSAWRERAGKYRRRPNGREKDARKPIPLDQLPRLPERLPERLPDKPQKETEYVQET